jgi:hypothetical protein
MQLYSIHRLCYLTLPFKVHLDRSARERQSERSDPHAHDSQSSFSQARSTKSGQWHNSWQRADPAFEWSLVHLYSCSWWARISDAHRGSPLYTQLAPHCPAALMCQPPARLRAYIHASRNGQLQKRAQCARGRVRPLTMQQDIRVVRQQ